MHGETILKKEKKNESKSLALLWRHPADSGRSAAEGERCDAPSHEEQTPHVHSVGVPALLKRDV